MIDLRFFLVFLIISSIAWACTDDESDENQKDCSQIVDYAYDGPSLLPANIKLQNVQTGELQIFSLDRIQSSTTVFSDTILCTYLTYDKNVTNRYVSNNDGLITYQLNQNYDPWINDFVVDYYIDYSECFINGRSIEEIEYFSPEYVFDKRNRRFLYVKDYSKEIVAIDNLQGDQWRNVEYEDFDFLCIQDRSFDQYKNSDTYQYLANPFIENRTFINQDGIKFQFERRYSETDLNYSILPNDQPCPFGSIEIFELYRSSVRWVMSERNISINQTIWIHYQSPTDGVTFYSFYINNNEIQLSDLGSGIEVGQDISNESKESWDFLVYHEKIDLLDSVFTDAYEIADKDGVLKPIFFQKNKGLIGFYVNDQQLLRIVE
jgi:hypothetical protein